MDQSTIDDLSSIEPIDVDNTTSSSSLLIQQMDTVDLDTEYDQLHRQVEELTKQLIESMKK
jgi:hypothetical protein